MIHIHLGVDQCLAAFQMVYQDKAGAVVVTEFFGRDETLAHLSFCLRRDAICPSSRELEACRFFRTASRDLHRREIHEHRIGKA